MDLPLTIADVFDGPYKATLVLHILAAIVGFGTVMLNGLRARRSKAAGEAGRAGESAAIAEDIDLTSGVAEWFIYAVPLFGIGLVFMSGIPGTDERVWDFDQTWVWLSLVIYGVALVLSLTLLQPDSRRMRELTRELAEMGPPPAGATEPPPQVEEMDRVGRRLGAVNGLLHSSVVVVLVLMVWKPGGLG